MQAASPSNPLPTVILALMEAVAALFRATATNYDIEYRRRERTTNRLETIYRIAAAIFARIQARMPRPLRPATAASANPAPTRPATAPQAPRRKRQASARILAARLVREIDHLACDIDGPVPTPIRTLLDQVLTALQLTRETIHTRAQALRARLARYSPRTATPATTKLTPALSHPQRPPRPPPHHPRPWASIFQR